MLDAYQIIDIADKERKLTIVAETTDRASAEMVKVQRRDGSCEVYAEVDGRLYRVICEERVVITEEGHRRLP